MSTPYGFIYVIENTENPKLYVGQTTRIQKRTWEHFDKSSGCAALQNAIRHPEGDK